MTRADYADRIRNWTRPVLAAGMACLLAAPASGFVVFGPDQRPGDAIAALALAPRWDANEASFVNSRERGLGGGLEFSVDAEFCAALDFVDDPSCEQIRAAIVEAGEKWRGTNAFLRLTDVTASVKAERSPDDGPVETGAEIDVFAVKRGDTPNFGWASGAVTRSIGSELKPRSTNGSTLLDAVGRITKAEIYFATEDCYYFAKPDRRRRNCAHFGSLLMHELAHVYGLDHPDIFPAWNIDSDTDPATPVAIDCRNPSAGLRQSGYYPLRAVALSTMASDVNWRRGLAADDIAGRDFLYPVCPDGDVPPGAP